MSRNNNVRGPTSALTEFLKASGITPTTIARRTAPRNQNQNDNNGGQNQAGAQPTAGPSNAPATLNTTRPSRTRSRLARQSGYASDNLDEDEMNVDEQEEASAPPAKKRKLTKAEEAKLKAKEKKKKGKKGDDDEDDDYEDEDDVYTALSKSTWSNSVKPPIGSFEKCAVCSKEFTVTKYTLAANSGNGFLCHQCAKAGGQDPFKKPAAPKKRKGPTEKRTIVNFEEKKFPTLVSLCVKLITTHIDDIDAFGDIGSMNLEAIAKALSNNRSLNADNAKLFYGPSNNTLTFYDATNLQSPALETLAYHNPNLQSLRLDFCGHLDDASFGIFSTSLPQLTRIELLGPFLVRTAAWQSFFSHHPTLEGFLITQSPRFDLDCVKSLTKHCPGIRELRLKEIGKLDDAFIKEIGSRLKKGVWYLDISDPTHSCKDGAMNTLLKGLGKTLTHLNLSKHDSLTDALFTKGLVPHVTKLESLTLSYLPEITDGGVEAFFEAWTANPPLTYLDLSRNEQLSSAALMALLSHSGKNLQYLNINGWKDVSADALAKVGHVAVELKSADISWCRAFDDFVLKVWLEGKATRRNVVEGGCRRLEEIKVWGCNRVTHNCPRRKGVVIYGVETHQVR